MWRRGELVEEPTDLFHVWRDDLVSFALGCSFSFEHALLEDGIELRHITCGLNVPMYRTSIPCTPAGPFSGPLVVSMRPLRPRDAIRRSRSLRASPRCTAPRCISVCPEAIGIRDLAKPDYGDAVPVKSDELPVFWACGVTPQAVIAEVRPGFLRHPRAGIHADHRPAQHHAGEPIGGCRRWRADPTRARSSTGSSG